jgi:hypothetical protein
MYFIKMKMVQKFQRLRKKEPGADVLSSGLRAVFLSVLYSKRQRLPGMFFRR